MGKVGSEFFLLLAIWNLALTGLVIRFIRHYRRLINQVDSGNLEAVLDRILDHQLVNRKEISLLKNQLKQLNRRETKFFQAFGLVKFNPFADLGGNQSFSLAIINREGKGLVVTGLHSRQTTRVYVKLLNGKKSQLSTEEKLAVKRALRQLKKEKLYEK